MDIFLNKKKRMMQICKQMKCKESMEGKKLPNILNGMQNIGLKLKPKRQAM